MDQSQHKYARLAQLSDDFVHLVKTYGKVIVMELNERDEGKKIFPRKSMGGVAGGHKFVVKGECID